MIKSLIENVMKDCTLCPRECHVDRIAGEIGFCHSGAIVKAARAALHFWEEPCISGDKGSGTVFFSGCNLGCVYCQNHAISRGEAGREVTVNKLSQIFLDLQTQGAWNINLVTPTHFIPQIQESLSDAKKKGLKLPIVYNCGGYEKVDSLRILEGLIDIYLPDLKYLSSENARQYSNAADYPNVAKNAIEEMVRQVGEAEFDKEGRMTKGVIVRYLLLPDGLEDGKEVLEYLFGKYGNRIFYSIMNQYTPVRHFQQFPELNRKVSSWEYEELIDFAVELGIENGFVQEGGTAQESFIPSFDGTGI